MKFHGFDIPPVIDGTKLEAHKTWYEIETSVPLPLALREGEEVPLYAVTSVAVEARGHSDSRAGADFRVTGQPLRVVFSKPVDPVPFVPPAPSEP